MTAARTKPRATGNTVARISKSHSTELRVTLSTWKGETKIELANFTSVIGDVYFQAGVAVTLPVEKIDLLIAALQKAKEAAR